MSRRVLVVDDEESIHALMNGLLQDEGFEVRCAFGEEDALLLAREWAPEIILSDIVLERISGFVLATRLQEITAAPILFFTGHWSDETVRDAKLLGVREVLRKPVASAGLIEALRRHLPPA